MITANSISTGTLSNTTNNTIYSTTTTGRTIADYIRESIAAIDMAKSDDMTGFIETRNLDKDDASQVICIPPIKDYAVYNGCVIKVDFVDGTSTKCVCDDEFDFYTGLAFCLFKRVLGVDGHKKFNRMMRVAIKQIDKIDEQKDKEKAEEARRKAKRRKAELKRAAKKAKERQDKIDIQVEAMRLYARENRGKDDA